MSIEQPITVDSADNLQPNISAFEGETSDKWMSEWLPEAKKIFNEATKRQLAKIHERTLDECFSDYYKIITKISEVVGIDTASLILKENGAAYHRMVKLFVKENHTLVSAIKHLADKWGGVVIENGQPTIDQHKQLVRNVVLVEDDDLPYTTSQLVAAVLYIAANVDKLKTHQQVVEDALRVSESNNKNLNLKFSESEDQLRSATGKLVEAQKIASQFSPTIELEGASYFIIANLESNQYIRLSSKYEGDGEYKVSDFVLTSKSEKAFRFSSIEEPRSLIVDIMKLGKITKIKNIENFSILKTVYKNMGS